VTIGGTATFTVEASGTTPFSYRWQRNGTTISGATGTSYSRNNVQLTDNGARFRVIVTNPAGSATSTEAVLTVSSNRVPTADVTEPTAGSLFQGGQTISYRGTGTDPDDGTLAASAFTWHALLFHDDGNHHSHPFYGPVTGSKSGSFTIPRTGETSSNIWYRIYLTVKDSQGATGVDSVDLLPRKVSITLASNPTGREIRLDGSPVTAPHTFTGVVGIRRTIEVVSPQTSGGQSWQFASWSDGGARSHTIATPSVATTYTASFSNQTQQQNRLYEAEAAARSGVAVSSLHPGYTGTGFGDYLHASTDYIEWTVTTAAAGTRSLAFRYALGVTPARSLKITVNGTVMNAGLTFPATGAWTTWRVVTLDVPLSAGTNRIRATAIGTSGPNLDHLTVQ
jgi:hypothetical protein